MVRDGFLVWIWLHSEFAGGNSARKVGLISAEERRLGATDGPGA